MGCFQWIDKGTNLGCMISELVVFVVAVFLLYVTGQRHVLKCSVKSFVKSLWSGVVILVFAVIGCAGYASDGMKDGFTYKSLFEIIAFIIFVILIGLAEEILCRGIITDSLFEYFGTSRKGLVLSVVMGGVLFGLTHISNVFAGQSWKATIIQVIGTSMLGILLSAIYIRHKNIYGVAFLHTALDFLTMFTKGFFEGNTLRYQYEDIDFWKSLMSSLYSQSIFIIITIFVLRPSIVKKIVERRKERDGACEELG